MLQAIVGGVLKGTKLKSLSGTAVRPTSARVREAVFNILQHRVKGASFIDVFAGNGAMGIEAISRGARAVTFVEKDSKVAQVIAANLSHCEERFKGSAFAETAPWPPTTVEPRDAFRLVAGANFDIVWLDPPYALYSERADQIVALAEGLVAEGGTVLLESDQAGAAALAAVLGEARMAQRRYSKSFITTVLPARDADVQ